MARGLKLDLIAEGVENRTQLRYLGEHGCREAQGFIFSQPVPARQMAELLRRNSYRELILADRQEGAATTV